MENNADTTTQMGELLAKPFAQIAVEVMSITSDDAIELIEKMLAEATNCDSDHREECPMQNKTEWNPKPVSELMKQKLAPLTAERIEAEFFPNFFRMQDKIMLACEKREDPKDIQMACVEALDEFSNRFYANSIHQLSK